MIKTAKEFLRECAEKQILEYPISTEWEQMICIDFAEKYHQAKLKNLGDIGDVMEQSEQFKCRNVACKEMTDKENGTVFCDKHKPYLGI